MKNKKVFLLVTVLFCSVLAATAQETSGGLEGRVSDKDGQSLAGAVVKAIHLPTGTDYQTRADSTGRYHLAGLRIGGPYKVVVTRVDRQTTEENDIMVSLGRNIRLDFILTENISQLKEVVVTSAKGEGRVNKYGAGVNISGAEIRRMPSATRSIQDITRMTPQGSKDNSFAGTNFRYNNVTIDGAINNDAIGFSPSSGGITGSSGMPGSSTRNNPVSMDAIEDIQVYLSPYDVKIGNFTGGSINAVTRSGSNEITGSLYFFGRNASITGRDQAGDGSRMPADFHEAQTGFRIGMPLVRNKLFFFTNEEITDRQDPVLLAAGSVQEAGVIGLDSAKMISDYLKNNYHFDAGAYGKYPVYSRSDKFFNRIDWNINSKNQLAVRDNYVWSKSTNLERDQQDFRFSSIDYTQTNTQHSMVAELKTHFNDNWLNMGIVGYTNIHDYRTPLSNPAFPQVQIAGATPGTTIFLGTDREASLFDMRQKTLEITDNLSWHHGSHTLLIGTHNELYDIQYGFVNSWNGRVDYLSVNDFLNNQPSRARGSYNYMNNDRSYIQAHPSAQFHTNFYSAYIQDELQVNDRIKVTYGLRADMAMVPHKPNLSQKTQDAIRDPFYGTTNTYTPLSLIHNDYLGWKNVQFSPRIGLNWDIQGDQSIVLRGGTGLFTGRIPLAWLGYTFYNNGDTYGAFDQRSVNKPFAAGSDPLTATTNGIASFAAANGQEVNNRYTGATQVDVIDNGFKMPQVWRSSVALDYRTANAWSLTLEAIYTRAVQDVKFQQVNTKDVASYYSYDTVANRQPIYSAGSIDPAFSNAYELSNTHQGYRYSLTGQIAKSFPIGLSLRMAYTYGKSMDISNGIRNSPESNWQLNQALIPNAPNLASSNFDIRHRIISTIQYRKVWDSHWASQFSLFVSSQSGSPFTWGFVNTSIQNTPQQVSLAYIPRREEAPLFFQDQYDAGGHITLTASGQAEAFNQFVDRNKYLSARRGGFTERNGGRTPWNTQADFRFTQDFSFSVGGHRQTVSFTYDIINLTNLLCKTWGRSYFSPNVFNSTAGVGLTPVLNPAQKQMVANGGYPQFTFQNPGTPYSIDFFQSRWQMQFGIRYSF